MGQIDRRLLLPLTLILWVAHFFPSSLDVKAQPVNGEWTDPVILYETNDLGSIATPFITTDQIGNVHVFWSVQSNNKTERRTMDLLYYTRWDGKTWSPPVDIIASERVNSPSATVDKNGIIHLLWYGPQGLYYNTATVSEAASARNWSKPMLIGQSYSHTSIVADSTGNVHLVFPGLDSSGPYYQFWDGVEQNWSQLRNISKTSSIEAAADTTQIAISQSGVIHVVWTEMKLPEGWPPIGLFYAQSDDGGRTWSSPFQVAGEGYNQINVITVGNKTVHLAWNGIVGIGGRYHRWSEDGGKTWTNSVEIVKEGLGGTEGPPQFVIDSLGILHFLTTFDHCAWFSSWQYREWDVPVCISGEEAMASDYIEESAMAISSGNTVHAVFWDDRTRVWYTSRKTLSPFVEPMPFTAEEPAVAAAPTLVSDAIPPGEIAITPVAPLMTSAGPGLHISTGQILLLSIAPVLIIVGLIMQARRQRAM